MALAVLLVSVLGVSSPGASGALLAAAAASGRPPECSSSPRRALSRGPTVWEIARVPTLQRYCDLVARAQSELASNPSAAKQSAEDADKALPGRASPQVIMARAALALGDADEAQRAFERAAALDPRSLEDPPTMHDRAVALLRAGKRDDALAVYRALVPRIDLLATNERRIAVLLEAASTSMSVEGAKPPAKASADEAIAYLREARRRPPSQLAGDVLVALALSLDRGGEPAQADATLAEAQRTTTHVHAESFGYLAATEDRPALDALVLEGGDRAAAARSWDAYLAGPGGKSAWANAARARLDAVHKGGGRDTPRKKSDGKASR